MRVKEDKFRELTNAYRRELQLHIYRIVGSAHDAEDLVQETMLAAWRGLEQFDERASVRAWLYGSPPTGRWTPCVPAGAAERTSG
jgi:DNA-directed RNA polymerase specialized sigma24 family protein